MILASGARGREFDSRITPIFFFIQNIFFEQKKNLGTMGIEPMTNGLLDQRSTDWAMRPFYFF